MTANLGPGACLGSHRIEAVAGCGGMGVVYRARHLELGRLVALKVLSPQLTTEPGWATRLRREARLAAAIDHPHIVPVYEVGEADGVVFLAMRFVEGTDVRRLVDESGPLPASRVVDLLRQAAAALDAAHARALIHRDVKPQNLLVADPGPGEHLYLADFGLSRSDLEAVETLTSGPLMGSVAYMAPEVLSGGRPDARADLYALAAVAFWCLTAQVPFPGDSAYAVAASHLYDPPPQVSTLPPDLGVAVDAAIAAGLAKVPGERPASCGDFVEDLALALEGTALRSRPRRSSLPAPPGRFVGRAEELAEVVRLCTTERLVTITGTGGVGKTRLAIEAARELEAGFSRVIVVELAALTSNASVSEALAEAVRARESAGRPPLVAVQESVDSDPVLLLVDNCEHLREGVAEAAASLLAACPALHVLATSRAPLDVSGETVWPLAPLSLPPDTGNGDTSGSDAVALLLERAYPGKARTELNLREREGVTRICRRLDGIPLALELAARRVRTLGIEEVANRLEDRLGFVTQSATRAGPSRQRTLLAALDWTHELLAAPEQIALRRLAVFSGGFTLEAAETVIGYGPLASEDIAELVVRLIDWSLAIPGRSGTAGGFRFLETTRDFALLRLDAAGEAYETGWRHFRWCLGIATEASGALQTAHEAEAAARLRSESENLTAALVFAGGRPEGTRQLLELAGLLGPFWERWGSWTEGRRWLQRGLAAPAAAEVEPRVVARAERYLGLLAYYQGEHVTGRRFCERALARYREVADAAGEASCLSALSVIAARRGDWAAAAEIRQELLRLARARDDRWAVARALNGVGSVALAMGDLGDAARLFSESLDLRRELGDRRGTAIARGNLGGVACDAGDFDAARRALQESIAIWREIGDRAGLRGTLANMGNTELGLGDIDGARGTHAEALRLAQELGDTEGVASGIEAFSLLAASEDPWRAARLAGAAEALRDSGVLPRTPADARRWQAHLSSVQAALGLDAYAAALAGGRECSPGDALVEALEDMKLPGT